MVSLHENQKRALEYLIDHPEGATLDELVLHLGITRTAVKEHIIRLQDLGYVNYQDERGGIGRPKRRYLLTPSGVEVFPKKYTWLSQVILQKLADDLGQAGTAKFMRQIADQVAAGLQSQLQASTPEERLKKTTQLMNELGYRATRKPKDAQKREVIEAVNCVYHGVAKEHPELCQFDIRLLEQATGMNVKLETCIARGGSVCRFCLAKKS